MRTAKSLVWTDDTPHPQALRTKEHTTDGVAVAGVQGIEDTGFLQKTEIPVFSPNPTVIRAERDCTLELKTPALCPSNHLCNRTGPMRQQQSCPDSATRLTPFSSHFCIREAWKSPGTQLLRAAVIHAIKSNNPKEFKTIRKLKDLRPDKEQIRFHTVPGCCFPEHMH